MLGWNVPWQDDSVGTTTKGGFRPTDHGAPGIAQSFLIPYERCYVEVVAVQSAQIERDAFAFRTAKFLHVSWNMVHVLVWRRFAHGFIFPNTNLRHFPFFKSKRESNFLLSQCDGRRAFSCLENAPKNEHERPHGSSRNHSRHYIEYLERNAKQHETLFEKLEVLAEK